MQLLSDDAERTIDLQKNVSVKEVSLNSTKSVLIAKEAAMKEKVLEGDKLNYDLDSAQVPLDRVERVIRDITERVCTGHTSSVHVQAGDYWDHLNALLKDEELRSEYLRG